MIGIILVLSPQKDENEEWGPGEVPGGHGNARSCLHEMDMLYSSYHDGLSRPACLQHNRSAVAYSDAGMGFNPWRKAFILIRQAKGE
jgi:hypothetical protein